MAGMHEEQIPAATTAYVNAAVGARRLVERLPQHLSPSDTVRRIAFALPVDRWWRELGAVGRQDGVVVVATDQALILVPLRVLLAESLLDEAMARSVERLPYEECDRIAVKVRLVSSQLGIQSRGRTVRVGSMRRKVAPALAEAVPVRLRT